MTTEADAGRDFARAAGLWRRVATVAVVLAVLTGLAAALTLAAALFSIASVVPAMYAPNPEASAVNPVPSIYVAAFWMIQAAASLVLWLAAWTISLFAADKADSLRGQPARRLPVVTHRT